MGGAGHPEVSIHELLTRRWSPRAFLPQGPTKTQLRSMFSAAAWAPSAFNSQPWRFIVGSQPDATWQVIHDCLDDGNRRWAGAAPVLALNVAQLRAGDRDLPTAVYDLGQAVALLTVEALSAGFYVHQMSGFDPRQARLAFDIPNEHAPITAMAIGRKGEPASLPEDLKARELRVRERRALADTVFAARYGLPAPWIHTPVPTALR